jgi:O-antigen/teichoic acid export membrane protein
MSMLRQFLRDSLVYGLAGILSRGVSLFLVPLYTRVLTPADYGVVDLLGVFATLVNLTIALEISQAVVRFYADSTSPDDRRGYASTSLWFTAAIYTTFVVLAMVMAPGIGQILLGGPERVQIIRVAIASIWVNGLFYLVQNQLRWELRPLHFAAVSLTYTGVSITASVVLVLILRVGVLGVVVGQLCGYVVGLAVGSVFTRRVFAFRFDANKLREMLRFSVPLVPSSIGVFVALYIDRITISKLMTLADVGLFGIGYRVASLMTLLMIGVQGALTPLIFSRYREPETPGEIARIFRFFTAIALLGCLALASLSPEVLRLVTVPAFYGAAQVVPLLAPASLISTMYIFAPGLGIAKRTGVMAIITLSGAALNTALNLLLVPRLGIVGAALGTLVSASLTFAAYMVTSQRTYRVPHDWGRLGLAVLVTIVLAAATLGLPVGEATTIALKGLALALAAALYLRLGLMEAGSLVRGIKRLGSGRSPPDR